MSHEEIAAKSGLSKSMVSTISNMTTWENLSISTVERFSLACGVDLLQPGVHRRYFRNRKLAHVMRMRSPNQSKMYFKLMSLAVEPSDGDHAVH